MRSQIESYSEQLWQFLWRTLLPAVPRLAWWVLGLLVFSGFNLLFSAEVWPHFPQAKVWFWFSMVPCLGVLPWLAARTAQQVRQRVRGWWWRGLWQLAIMGTYTLATMLSMLLLFGLILWLIKGAW